MPDWTARIAYAERFHLEPHRVNPPLRWWLRLGALDQARNQRQARELVERAGMDKVSPDTRTMYNELMLAMSEMNNGR